MSNPLQDLLDNRDVFDESGNLQENVQVVDPETGEVVADGKSNTNVTDDILEGDTKSSYRTETEKKYYNMPEEEKEKELRGDYCEFKKILGMNTRSELFDELRKTDRRRIVLLREHLLQLLSYHAQYADHAIEIIKMITRMMMGDFSTDLELENTIFTNLECDDSSPSDDDSSGLSPKIGCA